MKVKKESKLKEKKVLGLVSFQSAASKLEGLYVWQHMGLRPISSLLKPVIFQFLIS